jgi:tRNA-dihydrouridine synthase B
MAAPATRSIRPGRVRHHCRDQVANRHSGPGQRRYRLARKRRGRCCNTGADGLLIGRAAQGRPWIFREIAHFLATGEKLPEPGITEVRDILVGHLQALHAFYGEPRGVRIARKHLGWYAAGRSDERAFRQRVNRAEYASEQLDIVQAWFENLEDDEALAA